MSKSITLTDYSELRPKLRTGDLLLCAGTGWFSKMIQASTQSVWSHVAVIVRLESIDRVMLVESVEPIGVRAVPLFKYLHDYDGAGHPYPGTMRIARHQDFASHATPAGLARLGHYAIDQLGRPYDAYEIAKIAARITLASLTNLTLPLSPAPPLERDREYMPGSAIAPPASNCPTTPEALLPRKTLPTIPRSRGWGSWEWEGGKRLKVGRFEAGRGRTLPRTLN